MDSNDHAAPPTGTGPSRPFRFLVQPLIEVQSREDWLRSRREQDERYVKSSITKAWEAAIHETGWMDPTPISAEIGSQPGMTSAPEPDSDEDIYKAAFALVQKGAKRPPDTQKQADLHVETPERLKQAKKPLELKAYQAQALETMKKDYEDKGSGMVLALEMGTGKTIITLAFLCSVEPKARKPHLVVVPASLLEMWVREIEDRLGPVPNYCVYQDNPKRGRTTKYTPTELKQFDIVLVTYEKLMLDAKVLQATWDDFLRRHANRNSWKDPVRCNSTLSVTKWHIVVLEEGHRIANAESKTSAAVYMQQADYRLALTGTPFQNDYSDIQSMCRFLQIRPWNNVAAFYRFFMFKTKGETAFQTLRGHANAILALSLKAHTIRLRTTDTSDGQPVADFKEADTTVVKHDLSSTERAVQQLTRTLWDEEVRAKHQASVKAGEDSSSLEFTQTRQATTEARLAIIHGMCLRWRYGEMGEHDSLADESGDTTHDVFDESSAAHSDTTRSNRDRLRKETKTAWKESTRMETLVHWCKKHVKEHGGPMLVFSEFLSALDIAENALAETFGEPQKIARYDGTIPDKERDQVIEDFQAGKYAFLLVTTKCGALGLTLTRATGVVHLTPSWNPHQEMQASARAVRIGQEKKVQVYNMYAHDSIERRLRTKKRQKVKKANGILDPDTGMLDTMTEVATWDIAQLTRSLEEARKLSDTPSQPPLKKAKPNPPPTTTKKPDASMESKIKQEQATLAEREAEIERLKTQLQELQKMRGFYKNVEGLSPLDSMYGTLNRLMETVRDPGADEILDEESTSESGED